MAVRMRVTRGVCCVHRRNQAAVLDTRDGKEPKILGSCSVRNLHGWNLMVVTGHLLRINRHYYYLLMTFI